MARDSSEQSARASGNARVLQVLGDLNLSPGDPAESDGHGLIRPVAELTDPFDLEVHHAIEVQPSRSGPLPLLPQYVERDFDTNLSAAVESAVAGKSVFRILVGGSSTGKTRACWEAIKRLPPDWVLWHPIDPGRPEAVLAGLRSVGPRTVIWLNESQFYLLTPASDIGERVAAGLRELLRRPERAPVLILGTIWPEYWQTLTHRPPIMAPDPHAQARSLLDASEIPTPSSFSGAALNDMKAAAGRDPRLKKAIAQADDGQITQFLAGVPELMRRYRNAHPAAQALIHVAMDARRLGHELTIPHSLLADGAPAYLTDQEWDALPEDWLESSLDYCAAPCLGARGPLTRVRTRPGQAAPGEPTYRLADYLEQHGRAEREHVIAPPGVWRALAEHASENSRISLAQTAASRGLYHDAYRILIAKDHDYAGRYQDIGQIFRSIGRRGDALRSYLRAAGGDDPRAVAETLDSASRLADDDALSQELSEWLARRELPREAEVLHTAAVALRRTGNGEFALESYLRLAGTDRPWAAWEAAGALRAENRVDEALGLYRRAAEAGSAGALREAGDMLAELGRIEEAETLYRSALEAGDTISWWRLARLLRESKRFAEASTCFASVPEPGRSYALGHAAAMHARSGDVGIAIEGYARLLDEGHVVYAIPAAKLLAREARLDDALRCLDIALTAHDHRVLTEGFALLSRADTVESAADWVEQAVANTDNPSALKAADSLVAIGKSLIKRGNVESGLRLLTRVADDGTNAATISHGTEALIETGRAGEAIAWLAPWVERGITPALRAAGYAAKAVGRFDEAIDLWLRSAETTAAAALAEEIARTHLTEHRTKEALTYYRMAARDIKTANIASTASFLVEAGYIEETEEFCTYVAEFHGRGSQQHIAATGVLARAVGIETMLQHIMINPTAWSDQCDEAVRVLLEHGLRDKAIDWLITLGSPEATSRAAKLLLESGHHNQALAIYEKLDAQRHRGAEVGVLSALLALNGPESAVMRAVGWLESGRSSGRYTISMNEVAKMLKIIGLEREAGQLAQYGVISGKGISAPW